MPDLCLPAEIAGLSYQGEAMVCRDRVCTAEGTTSVLARRGPPGSVLSGDTFPAGWWSKGLPKSGGLNTPAAAMRTCHMLMVYIEDSLGVV